MAFYRDALGLSEVAAFSGGGDAHVTILDAGRATLELANHAQRKMIDEVEVGHPTTPRLRVAFEVRDAAGQTQRLVEAGRDLGRCRRPRRLGDRSTPGSTPRPDLHITLFEELTETEQFRRAPSTPRATARAPRGCGRDGRPRAGSGRRACGAGWSHGRSRSSGSGTTDSPISRLVSPSATSRRTWSSRSVIPRRSGVLRVSLPLRWSVRAAAGRGRRVRGAAAADGRRPSSSVTATSSVSAWPRRSRSPFGELEPGQRQPRPRPDQPHPVRLADLDRLDPEVARPRSSSSARRAAPTAVQTRQTEAACRRLRSDPRVGVRAGRRQRVRDAVTSRWTASSSPRRLGLQ